jgi:sirohydrochlorin cobaltochelatase
VNPPAHRPPVPPALLLVGHGTRDAAGAEAFRTFVEQLGAADPALSVGGGFIELSPPPLADSVARMVAAGVRDFAAVPLVLVSAGHAKGDIPAALAREERRHPGTSFTYGRPLGPHPNLLRVLERRVDEASAGGGPAGRATDRAGTTVLLVGRGSTDPDANAEVFKVARLLWEGRGYAGVETAFVSLAEPSVAAGLDRCRRLGAGRVVVLPYFLFAGVLPDRVREQAAGWAREHPGVDVRHAEVIGPEPELAELVRERYREVAGGTDLRMNCDSCVYRVKLPGFEDRVGRPQQPHHHPEDPAGGPGHRHTQGPNAVPSPDNPQGHGHHHAHTH